MSDIWSISSSVSDSPRRQWQPVTGRAGNKVERRPACQRLSQGLGLGSQLIGLEAMLIPDPTMFQEQEVEARGSRIRADNADHGMTPSQTRSDGRPG